MANTNPLIHHKGLPRFDLIEPTHISEVVGYLKLKSQEYLQRLATKQNMTWQEYLKESDSLDFVFQQSWSPISHLTSVKNSDLLRAEYEKYLPEIVEVGLELEQNQKNFEHLQKIISDIDFKNLKPALQRIFEKKLKSARLSGVGLSGSKRERFNEIAKRLSDISTKFSNHILDATKSIEFICRSKDEVAGLPADFLHLASDSYKKSFPEQNTDVENGPWRITIDGPVYIQVMRFAKNRQLREKVYRAKIKLASSGAFDNRPLIDEILSLRQEKSQLLGYTDYAQLSIDNKMAPSVKEIEEFLLKLRAAARPLAEKELQVLKEFNKENNLVEGELCPWDFTYVAEVYREKSFSIHEQELKKYFPLQRVLDGLWKLAERLFDVKICAANGETSVWHSDVQYFKIQDAKTGKDVASFYLDPYSRPAEKRGGAWMNGAVDRWLSPDGEYLPCAYLICNSNSPAPGQPSLMSFDEVVTLFHEFGHGLQHMLTTVPYMSAAGINGVEWDAVELPSQFMENWCYDRNTLDEISSHYQTGQVIPDDLYANMLKERYFLEPTQMLRQITFALTDLYLHQPHKLKQKPSALYLDVAKQTMVMDVLPEDEFLCSFSHIFAGGYAAGYYSYKWAEVLSADAFSKFVEVGLDNLENIREVGHQFRDTVLAQGGSRHPMDVFVDFRGRKPDPLILVRQLGVNA